MLKFYCTLHLQLCTNKPNYSDKTGWVIKLHGCHLGDKTALVIKLHGQLLRETLFKGGGLGYLNVLAKITNTAQILEPATHMYNE